MTILEDLIYKLIKEILKSKGSDVFNIMKDKFKGGYLETETEITADPKNVTFQKEPVVNVEGGSSWAKIKGSGVKKTNPWLDHVAKVKSENSGMKYKDVLKKAKETYTKKETTKGGVAPAHKAAIVREIIREYPDYDHYDESYQEVTNSRYNQYNQVYEDYLKFLNLEQNQNNEEYLFKKIFPYTLAIRDQTTFEDYNDAVNKNPYNIDTDDGMIRYVWSVLEPLQQQKVDGTKMSNQNKEYAIAEALHNEYNRMKDKVQLQRRPAMKKPTKGGQVKNEHYYKSRVIDPVAEQKDQQKELKQKKPRGRPRKSQVTVDIPKAEYTKSETIKEKGKKLTVKKPLKYEILNEPTTLSFEKPKERKFEKTALDRVLGIDSDLLPRKKPAPRKAPQPDDDFLPLPADIFGSGATETEMLNQVMKQIKDISTEAKKIAFARKFIETELKKRKLKPFIRKQILNYVLTEIKKLKGGIDPISTHMLVTTLKETGIIDATKSTLKSLTDRLDVILKNPEEHRKRVIITRDIPNLQFKFDKLKNLFDIKSNRWTDVRKENAKLQMLNVKSHIVALLNRVAGINSIKAKT